MLNLLNNPFYPLLLCLVRNHSVCLASRKVLCHVPCPDHSDLLVEWHYLQLLHYCSYHRYLIYLLSSTFVFHDAQIRKRCLVREYICPFSIFLYCHHWLLEYSSIDHSSCFLNYASNPQIIKQLWVFHAKFSLIQYSTSPPYASYDDCPCADQTFCMFHQLPYLLHRNLHS